MHDYVNEFLEHTQGDSHRPRDYADNVRPAIRMCTGVWLSIQASRFHYCTPRSDWSSAVHGFAYKQVEVKAMRADAQIPIELWHAVLKTLEEGASGGGTPLPSGDIMFGYCDVDAVNKAIEMLGSMYTIVLTGEER